jgi:3D (Asp-Asp-Asp) domain-containing protein
MKQNISRMRSETFIFSFALLLLASCDSTIQPRKTTTDLNPPSPITENPNPAPPLEEKKPKPPLPTPSPSFSPTVTPTPTPAITPSPMPLLTELPLLKDSFEMVEEEMIGKFRNTYYYLKEEAPYANKPKDTSLLTPKGSILAPVNSTFKKLLDIEGSGLLIDGRVVNFAGVVGGVIRYLPTIHPWGRGVGNCALRPFRSIAVDPKEIAFGSIVRIQETIGMPLPDGTLHDGYWVTSDTGGAIRGDRIDLFSGKESWGNTFSRFKIKHLQALTITLIARPNEKTCAYLSGH